MNYDQSQATLSSREDLDAKDFVTMNDADRVNYIASHNELPGFTYTAEEVARLLDFLNALTDPSSIDLRKDVPQSVPVVHLNSTRPGQSR